MKNFIQKTGRFLSGMVMPNIGSFIAWGFLTAIFLSPGGWFPSEKLSHIQPYLINFLLPLLIAGQGGYMVGGTRGRVIASIAIMGCITQDASQYQEALREYAVQKAMFENGLIHEITATASTTPMLMASMIVGPFSGWIIKRFDNFMKNKMPAGFEMLINNFSVGIFGLALAIAGYLAVGPFMSALLAFIACGIKIMTDVRAIPAVAVLLEPAKVLFLNNAINHGIFTPLGASDIQETGKSIMYMLETNPGPGLGVLLAYWIFSKDKNAKNSAPGAIIVHFFGGIHEISFPYILANPLIIIGPIAGNACAITWFMYMDAGLMGPASPGSIISFMLMSPKDTLWVSAVGVAIATVISFLLSALVLKISKGKSLDEAKEKKDAMKAESKGVKLENNEYKNISEISKIIFACDAGMGSSAMGATRFAKRIAEYRPDIIVKNYAIDEIPNDADIVICQKMLADRANKAKPKDSQIIKLDNFLADPSLDSLFLKIKNSAKDTDDKNKLYSNNNNNKYNKVTIRKDIENEDNIKNNNTSEESLIPKFINQNNSNVKEQDKNIVKLQIEGIKLGKEAKDKHEVIQYVGKILKHIGCVDDKYVSAMHDRENEVSTYLGNGIAIPHGTSKARKHVKKSGIVFAQYPKGVSFGKEKAYLIFGIAGVGDEHLDLLAKISLKLEDDKIVEKLKTTNDKQYVLSLFNN